MLFLSRSDVEALLDPRELIDALAGAMADLSAGRASLPNRIAALVQERDGLLAAMPAYVPATGALTTKLVSLFPRNAGTALATHQALVVSFDPETGRPVAVMDGEWLTALRTGAGSALSTRLLARPDADALAIVGTGVQARSHAATVPLVRDFSEVRVAGRSPGRAHELAEELRAQGLPARAAGSYEEAIRGSAVVCAATHTTEPVVRREWLSPGTHVTSVGYNTAGREVDAGTVRDALVTVESRAAALAPPPAGATELNDGSVSPADVAEIGELVSGTRAGRSSADQLTLYKSVGVGVQDAAAAALVLAAARREGAGVDIEL